MSDAETTERETPRRRGRPRKSDDLGTEADIDAGAGEPESDDAADKKEQPDLLMLDRDFGFSLNGVLRVWHADKPVTKPADITELLANGAPCRRFKEIPCPE